MKDWIIGFLKSLAAFPSECLKAIVSLFDSVGGYIKDFFHNLLKIFTREKAPVTLPTIEVRLEKNIEIIAQNGELDRCIDCFETAIAVMQKWKKYKQTQGSVTLNSHSTLYHHTSNSSSNGDEVKSELSHSVSNNRYG